MGSVQRGQIVNAQVKHPVIGQHELFLLGLRQPGHNVAVRFGVSHGEQRFKQAVSGQDGAALVDHDGADLAEHLHGAPELLQLLVGVHPHIPLRGVQLGQGLLCHFHALTPSRNARALTIFSAAAVTMEGSMS